MAKKSGSRVSLSSRDRRNAAQRRRYTRLVAEERDSAGNNWFDRKYLYESNKDRYIEIYGYSNIYEIQTPQKANLAIDRAKYPYETEEERQRRKGREYYEKEQAYRGTPIRKQGKTLEVEEETKARKPLSRPLSRREFASQQEYAEYLERWKDWEAFLASKRHRS